MKLLTELVMQLLCSCCQFLSFVMLCHQIMLLGVLEVVSVHIREVKGAGVGVGAGEGK